jgi:hypothetical protein
MRRKEFRNHINALRDTMPTPDQAETLLSGIELLNEFITTATTQHAEYAEFADKAPLMVSYMKSIATNTLTASKMIWEVNV